MARGDTPNSVILAHSIQDSGSFVIKASFFLPKSEGTEGMQLRMLLRSCTVF